MVGVPGEYSFEVKFSTGLSDGGQLVESWVSILLIFSWLAFH